MKTAHFLFGVTLVHFGDIKCSEFQLTLGYLISAFLSFLLPSVSISPCSDQWDVSTRDGIIRALLKESLFLLNSLFQLPLLEKW